MAEKSSAPCKGCGREEGATALMVVAVAALVALSLAAAGAALSVSCVGCDVDMLMGISL